MAGCGGGGPSAGGCDGSMSSGYPKPVTHSGYPCLRHAADARFARQLWVVFIAHALRLIQPCKAEMKGLES